VIAPAQRTPLAFFGLLGSQGPNVPNQVPDTIQPTLEMLELLKAANQFQLFFSAAMAAPGFFTDAATFTVPPGEAWWLHYASCTTGVPIGNTVQNAIALAQAGSELQLSEARNNPVLAVAVTAVETMVAPPQWMRAGQTLGIRNFNSTAGSTYNLTALVSKFRSGF